RFNFHLQRTRGNHLVISRRHAAGGEREKMSKKSVLFVVFLAIVVLLAIEAHAQVPGPLKLTQTIQLPGLKDGDFDHFALDSAGQRLFLDAEENSTVAVIDLRTNKLIGKFAGAK